MFNFSPYKSVSCLALTPLLLVCLCECEWERQLLLQGSQSGLRARGWKLGLQGIAITATCPAGGGETFKVTTWSWPATSYSLARRRRSPRWWWPGRCCLGCRARWPPAAVRSSGTNNTAWWVSASRRLHRWRDASDPRPQNRLHSRVWAAVPQFIQMQDANTAPVSCRGCRSPWWWFPWRKAERISPRWPTRSPFCRLAWSSW